MRYSHWKKKFNQKKTYSCNDLIYTIEFTPNMD